MTSERVKELLRQLHQELEAKDVDPETLSLVRQLDGDIHDLLNSHANAAESLLERVEEVEVRFAVKHGVAERILREIVETLARMGV